MIFMQSIRFVSFGKVQVLLPYRTIFYRQQEIATQIIVKRLKGAAVFVKWAWSKWWGVCDKPQQG